MWCDIPAMAENILLPGASLEDLRRLGGTIMPAIASLEDLKAAQRDLLNAKDLNELKSAFKRWRKICWKNLCKLWLQERTPEQLKGARD
jgi:hypothetical protein